MGLVDGVLGSVSLPAIAVLAVSSYVVYYIAARYAEYRYVMSKGGYAPEIPSYLPWCVDYLYKMIQATSTRNDFYFYRDYVWKQQNAWTVESRPLGNRFIFTADPANVKAILATQFEDFGKGKDFHKLVEPLLGNSIFATDGQLWHNSRQLIRPSFSRDRVSDLETFEHHCQTLFKAIANRGPLDGENQSVDLELGNGQPVDMKDLFFRLTLDVTTEFLMGHDVKSLSSPKQAFMQAFDDVQYWQNIITRANFMQKVMYKPAYWNGLRVMNDFIGKYVDIALRLSPEELATKTKGNKGYTFLHEVVSYTRDPKVIRDQIVAVLLAGRDTTAGTLSWTIYELARRPDIVAKLRAEILDHVGRDNMPTYDHLKNMPYLKSILNETLRLYPSVPFNRRHALKDTYLPRGGGPKGDQPLFVREGTPVVYSPLVMQRRPELYPETSEKFADPMTYEPERWNHWHPKPHDYVPFNAGPRICIGQQFALTEMSYIICRMFQKFDRLETHMDAIDNGTPLMQNDLTLAPAQGVLVSFWNAKD